MRSNTNRKTTNRLIKDVFPTVLSEIHAKNEEGGDLILHSWPKIIGPQFQAMTEALYFRNGVLTVRVKNSTLYSLLVQHEAPKLLYALKKKFPQSKITKLQFRM